MSLRSPYFNYDYTTPDNFTLSYNTYLTEGSRDNRESQMSGHGAIGGLMGGSLSDDDSDDEDPRHRPANGQGMSKNQGW